MKLVTFNRAMVGVGNPALIEDETLIARLVAEGVVLTATDWPPLGAKPPDSPRRAQTYLTKAAKKLKGSAGAARELV
jgi:hypothetical protein